MKILLAALLPLLLLGCGGTEKVVAVTTVAEACERIEQHIEDQDAASTDLETVQGELSCTRTVCDRLMDEIETSGGAQ